MQVSSYVRKVLLTGTPGEIVATLEEQSRVMAPDEYMAGARVRLLAAELAYNTGLQAHFVTYGTNRRSWK
jgi:hypothetical protein